MARWSRRLELQGAALWVVGSVGLAYDVFGSGSGHLAGDVGSVVMFVGVLVYLAAAILGRQRSASDPEPIAMELPLPAGLVRLIENGEWPRAGEPNDRRIGSQLSADDLERWAPGEPSLVLDPPPFITLAREVAMNPGDFWSEFGALDEIDPHLAVIIGDFGHGSDTAIVLDYRRSLDRRRSLDEPRVMRLAWTDDGNHWVEVAPSFDAFVALLRPEA